MSMPGTMYPTLKPEERTDTRTERQPPYAIILHNDDVNTMEFVVAVLRKVFGYTVEKCVELIISGKDEAIRWSDAGHLISKNFPFNLQALRAFWLVRDPFLS